jgi:predicted lipoprotein with Yx(FWY)xxD motif
MNLLGRPAVVMGMNTDVRAGTGSREQEGASQLGLLLRLAGAGLLLATGGMHLDLYLTGYRTIPTIGWLFLLQVIAAIGLGLVVLVTGSRLAAAAGAAFALSTLGGYLLSVQFGLFAFREVRTTAGIVAGIIEVAAFAALAVYAATPRLQVSGMPGRSGRPSGSGGPRESSRAGRSIPSLNLAQAGLGVAGISVVALGLLGGAVAGAGSTGQSAVSGSLRTEQIGGATVLATSSGRTLYWFAPDTSTKSVCNGGCALYWPPLKGPLTNGAGVPGTLSTIRRADGSIQETYNGHPLYTYINDFGPGQARGNNVTLNGGLWHEVIVAG